MDVVVRSYALHHGHFYAFYALTRELYVFRVLHKDKEPQRVHEDATLVTEFAWN